MTETATEKSWRCFAGLLPVRTGGPADTPSGGESTPLSYFILVKRFQTTIGTCEAHPRDTMNAIPFRSSLNTRCRAGSCRILVSTSFYISSRIQMLQNSTGLPWLWINMGPLATEFPLLRTSVLCGFPIGIAGARHSKCNGQSP